MKKIFTLLSVMLFTGFFFNSCKNPTDDIEVLFDASVINYKASIMVVGSTGETLPTSLTVTLTGADKDYIYDFSGDKTPYAPGGIITLGVHYKHEPTAAKSVNFNVVLKATGYEDANIPMSIVNGQLTQLKKVVLQKTGNSTTAATYVSATTTLTGNATTAVIPLTTATNANVPTVTSISIPAGTEFKTATGAALTGTALTSQIFNYDTTDPEALKLFPGGELSASSVILPGTTVAAPAFFLPAGFASIKMFVGSTEVKSFTKDISVSIELDPNYKSFTGAALTAGTVIPIYSYDVASGQFKYEKDGTVTANGNKLVVTFTTNHLTVYTVGYVSPTSTCKDVNINVSAAWLKDASRPVKVKLYTTSNVLLGSTDMVVSNGFQATVRGLPNIPLKYTILDIANDAILAFGDLASPCSGPTVNVTLTEPTVAFENITLKLNVKCPGKGTILIPNFDIYYKIAGSSALNYSILGTASDGLLKTTLLTKGTAYDFKAVWGNSAKQVLKRTITEQDNSASVGDGALSPEDNGLLIQACK
ncbi:hypothetical protein LPB86_01260 [Pedobacter sp. MC2016-14]|uniref:hypothetical protein n=1 Tax=Pedobacter sp. MC2016-14 TaxID=2897327 RepID=UPI001E46728B|nr:hypothetical protein [Pedobacter sp. MC2016-14]MCD0486836.1 hypothetical protein [Pedobacter sp. MC2016-14]